MERQEEHGSAARILGIYDGTSIELNRFAVGKNELPLDPDDLGFSS
jgi:hypothetical protein